jgi:hypothetical protein
LQHAIVTSPDPWAAYRKPNGEFDRWLHLFHIKNRIGGELDPRRNTVMNPACSPAPWLFDGRPDYDLIRATHQIGALKHYPHPWPALGVWLVTARTMPIYWAVLPRFHEEALRLHLDTLRAQCVTDVDYCQLLDSKFRFNPWR